MEENLLKKRIQTVVNLCDLYGNILWTCELDVLYVMW